MGVNVKICFFVLIMALLGCRKIEEVSAVPAIELVSFETTGDQGKLIISFTDGDGDVGLNEEDTLSPYQFGGEFYTNLKMEYWEKVHDEFRLNANQSNNQRIPNLTPSGQIKSLEGQIEVILAPRYYALRDCSLVDTFMYRIYLVDRALQYSNAIETQELIRP